MKTLLTIASAVSALAGVVLLFAPSFLRWRKARIERKRNRDEREMEERIRSLVERLRKGEGR